MTTIGGESARDNPASREQSAKPIEVTVGSGNVFRDLGFAYPEAELAKADARIAREDAEARIPTTFTGLPILGRPMKVTIDLLRSPGLDALRAIVEPLLYGGRMEHVSVLHEGKRTDMFVCENSAYLGNVRNDKATKIYRTAWLADHPKDDPESLSVIYGPAVLVDRRVWF